METVTINKNDDGTRTCIKCNGKEDILLKTNEDMYLHLEIYHGWNKISEA